MRQETVLQNMTRLGWDQSFLEDFSDSDSLSHPHEEFLRVSFDETNVQYENIYNGLGGMTGSSVIHRAMGSPYANSNAIVDADHLKFLLNQVERKKRTQQVDNSYSSSSQLIPTGSSLPPSPTLHPKGFKVPRKDSDRKDDIRLSPRENSLARNGIGFPNGDSLTPNSFFIFRLVERYRLAKILYNQIPQDPIFQVNTLSSLTSQSSIQKELVEAMLASSCPYSLNELQIFKTNLIYLLESGFYLGKLTAEESRKLLNDTALGTFFVRDSSNLGHLLSLSVLTRRGATSIRIYFRDGKFGLETDTGSAFTPKFDSVLKLVQYYAENPYKNVLVESSGRCDTPVVLGRPLFLRVPGLAHLTRLTIHRHLRRQKVDRLCLIPSLKQFLKQYPFSV